MRFWRLMFPRDVELRGRQLTTARIDMLIHLAHAEYHSAMAAMLKRRIARLEADDGQVA